MAGGSGCGHRRISGSTAWVSVLVGDLVKSCVLKNAHQGEPGWGRKGVFVHLCWDNTMNWGGFTSNRSVFLMVSGGWEVQDLGASRLGVWRGPDSWFTEGHLLAVSSHGQRGEGALWGLFIRALIPFMRAPPSWPNHLPKAPPLKTITLLMFSCSVMSDSLRPRGLLHARLPCPSLSPGVCSNSGSLSWWCHPTISSSVALFSSCHQSFPASLSFPMSQLLASGGQSIGVSASATVFPMNSQGWFPLGLIGDKLRHFLSSLFHLVISLKGASMVAQMVKNLPAMWETWVRSLSWEDPLEDGMATHSGILAWRILMDRGAWRARVQGVAKSWTWLSTHTHTHARTHTISLSF